ncbi:unnamed protein product [Anisakis simplex]|uniref:Type I site-specific deoxyribonuclease n=1 Tax=Anisakis simplex TaxID=6269 RepID=A0A0M3JMI0_ANISI|nr:unnamed protein product [Anisakis simplex]
MRRAGGEQQDIEDAQHPEPLKYKFELDLVEKLRRGEDLITNEEEFRPKKTESVFGERLLGRYFNPLAEKFRKY